MAHSCYKCKAEYASGAFLGGHDYCMTCYTRMKQDDEGKRRREEALRQQRDSDKIHLRREQLERDYLAQRREQVGTVLPKKKEGARAIKEDDLVRRIQHYRWDVTTPATPVSSPVLSKMAVAQKPGVLASYRSVRPSSAPGPPHHKDSAASRSSGHSSMDQEDLTRSLEAQQGLPVSLSAGQKGILLLLAGRNRSQKKASVELFATLIDSKKNPVRLKIEPANCSMEAGASAPFEIKFDLSDEAPSGPLSFSAHLKESAIYMDRDSA